MELEPFRKPHPPLWYGVVNPDSAERAAKAGMNFISNSTAAVVKAKVARYSAAYQGHGRQRAAPKFGMNRYMVLAETEDEGAGDRRGAPIGAGGRASCRSGTSTTPRRPTSTIRRRSTARSPTAAPSSTTPGQGARTAARAACGIRRELSGLPLRLRRPVAVGIDCARWSCSSATSCRALRESVPVAAE